MALHIRFKIATFVISGRVASSMAANDGAQRLSVAWNEQSIVAVVL
jgi:hypothetical protein